MRQLAMTGMVIGLMACGAVARAQDTDASQESLVVILNGRSPVTSMTREELQAIYLGRQTHFSNGKRIMPFVRSPGSPAGKLFFRDVLQMMPARFAHHWNKAELSGAGTAPKQVDLLMELGAQVAGAEGAIGVVTAREVNALASFQLKQVPLSK